VFPTRRTPVSMGKKRAASRAAPVINERLSSACGALVAESEFSLSHGHEGRACCSAAIQHVIDLTLLNVLAFGQLRVNFSSRKRLSFSALHDRDDEIDQLFGVDRFGGGVGRGRRLGRFRRGFVLPGLAGIGGFGFARNSHGGSHLIDAAVSEFQFAIAALGVVITDPEFCLQAKAICSNIPKITPEKVNAFTRNVKDLLKGKNRAHANQALHGECSSVKRMM
jgi:hypothetical protein